MKQNKQQVVKKFMPCGKCAVCKGKCSKGVQCVKRQFWEELEQKRALQEDVAAGDQWEQECKARAEIEAENEANAQAEHEENHGPEE